MSVLLMYGTFLGYGILDQGLQKALVLSFPTAVHSRHWSKGIDWAMYLQFWGLAITDDIFVGSIFLMALLTTPLPSAMFLYHVYLIWSGMTTNESSKWADWRDDIVDGLVFKAKRTEIYVKKHPDADIVEPDILWSVKADQTLIFTDDGEPPRVGFRLARECTSIEQPEDPDSAVDLRWRRVKNLRDVDNIYDLGFWSNLRDALGKLR
ncbi:hypothetical protein FQN50_002331 [Emmonsiellopsis sp. PD_5]|nr:hypothetical protein FQN50_002331 [Emmonsiellopsis sp. PD_5]